MLLATLIGDLVGSRLLPDRASAQEQLVEVLAQVNGEVAAVQPLETTIGDEFQGAYAELASAVQASLLIRLRLLPLVDSRYGVGLGDVTVFESGRTPLSQDGPGWWAAREGIEQVQSREGRRASARGTRTWFVDRSGEPALIAPAMNAFLLCRDESVGMMGERARRLLLGWLQGRTQSELAEQEGISQSAVSQALGRSGAYALRDAQQALAGERG